MRETLWVPVVAVLGPLIGSAVGVLLPSREGLLHRLLAFAAGTMLTLSFLELIPESLSACSPPACAAGNRSCRDRQAPAAGTVPAGSWHRAGGRG